MYIFWEKHLHIYKSNQEYIKLQPFELKTLKPSIYSPNNPSALLTFLIFVVSGLFLSKWPCSKTNTMRIFTRFISLIIFIFCSKQDFRFIAHKRSLKGCSYEVSWPNYVGWLGYVRWFSSRVRMEFPISLQSTCCVTVKRLFWSRGF